MAQVIGVAKFACDGEHCHAKAEADEGTLPAGWENRDGRDLCSMCVRTARLLALKSMDDCRGKTTPVRFSDDRRNFYLPEFSTHRDFWLSTEASDEEPPARNGLGGLLKEAVRFTVAGHTYYRDRLPFAFWKVQSSLNIEEQRPMDEEMILDYISVLMEQRRTERRAHE